MLSRALMVWMTGCIMPLLGVAADRAPVAFSQQLVVGPAPSHFGVRYQYVDPDITGRPVFFPGLEVTTPFQHFPRFGGSIGNQACAFQGVCSYAVLSTQDLADTQTFSVLSRPLNDPDAEPVMSAPATISVQVVDPLDRPYAWAMQATAFSGVPVELFLGGIGPEISPALQYEIVSGPQTGEMDRQPGEQFSTAVNYVSAPGFTGTDAFEFVVHQADMSSTPVEVTITVIAPAGPVATDAVPDRGPVNGGNEITISGVQLGAGLPEVTIGGSTATVNSVDNETIDVSVPGGVEGSADIAVQIGEATSTIVSGYTYEPIDIQIVSSILPASRSVVVGAPATAFATLINAGNSTAENCRIESGSGIDADFAFQTTDSVTNALTGEENQSVTLAAGAVQSFVIALTPRSAFTPMDVEFDFVCDGGVQAPIFGGVNTLLMSAEETPVPDIVAVATTNPATTPAKSVSVSPEGGSDFFAVATANAGVDGVMSVEVDTGNTNLPVELSVCVDPADCFGGSAVLTDISLSGGSTASFFVLVTARDLVDFLPGLNRIYVRFKDVEGITRGSTSVAVAALAD